MKRLPKQRVKQVVAPPKKRLVQCHECRFSKPIESRLDFMKRPFLSECDYQEYSTFLYQDFECEFFVEK